MEIAAITALFSPVGYQSLAYNYQRFAEAWKTTGVPLYTIECSFPWQTPILKNDQFAMRVESTTPLFIKECLLNKMAASLPRDVQYVVVLDCDLIWESYDWVQSIPRVMQHYQAIQPFREMIDLTKDGQHNKTIPSWCYAREETGYGFCQVFKREFFDLGGYFDMMLLGAGDTLIWQAAQGGFNGMIGDVIRQKNQTVYKRALRWMDRMVPYIDGQVGYLDETAYHMWHGDRSNRQYRDRWEIFAQMDPDTMLVKNDHGIWNLHEGEDAFQDQVLQYFRDRREEPPSKMDRFLRDAETGSLQIPA